MKDPHAANLSRLKALIEILGVTKADLARAVGYSRPYCSRLLSGDPAVGTPEFYRKVESVLPRLIEMRKRSYFSIAGVDTAAVETLKAVASQAR